MNRLNPNERIKKPLWVSERPGEYAQGKKRTILGWMTEEELFHTHLLERKNAALSTPSPSLPAYWTGAYHPIHGGKIMEPIPEITIFEHWKKESRGIKRHRTSDEHDEKINIEDANLF